MPALPGLRFIEQYDPEDESAKSQPFAYVADVVHEIPLGVDVDEIRGKGVDNEAWGSLLELRDKIAPDEKVSWFVVVNGDIERWAPPPHALLEDSNGSTHTHWSHGSLSGISNSTHSRPSEDQVSNGLLHDMPGYVLANMIAQVARHSNTTAQGVSQVVQ